MSNLLNIILKYIRQIGYSNFRGITIVVIFIYE